MKESLAEIEKFIKKRNGYFKMKNEPIIIGDKY